MKHSKTIKNLFTLGALILATGWTQTLCAFTYTNTDLMLVFRKDGFFDVEFNIGSVSNYLGKPSGTVIPVTNWNLALVRTNFNTTQSLAGIKFILAAVTDGTNVLANRRAWLTDGNQGDAPTDVTGSRLGQIISKITLVGANAAAATFTNSSQSYVTNASEPTAYTAIVSGGLDVSNLGGSAPFPVESDAPATNKFIQLKAGTSPFPAATIVGAFSLTDIGVLTFTAGSPIVAPRISIVRSGSVNTITVLATVTGVNYRLRYSNILGPSPSTWSVLGTMAGNGSDKAFPTHSPADAQGFYAVEAY